MQVRDHVCVSFWIKEQAHLLPCLKDLGVPELQIPLMWHEYPLAL
jgi:hypothetical protein